MRSYSFDMKFDDSIRKSPKKFQIKLHSLMLNYIFLTFIVANKFLFTFHQQKISVFIELLTFVFCVNVFYSLYNLSNLTRSEAEDINYKKSFLIKQNYSKYFIVMNIVDMLIVLFYENEGFKSFNNYEIYFSYLKLAFNMIIVTIFVFIQLYFRRFLNKMKLEITENYEI